MSMTRMLTIMAILIMSNLIIGYVFAHLAIVTTPSISPQILWRAAEPPIKGDYVLFRWIYPPQLKEERWLAKILLCDEGDILIENGGAFYCNQNKITKIPNVFKNKYRSKLQRFNGKIPKGEAFVGSSHSAGFDSRYFGFVRKKQLSKALVML